MKEGISRELRRIAYQYQCAEGDHCEVMEEWIPGVVVVDLEGLFRCHGCSGVQVLATLFSEMQGGGSGPHQK